MHDLFNDPSPEREPASMDNLGCEIIEVDGPEDDTVRPIPEDVRKQIEEWPRRQRRPSPPPAPEPKPQ